ncbi:hypothetical protein [Halomonas sp. HL-93]|uniref:hypothetical protein n=1 Tax=Halomonas sp. HL-93 TaxID=1666906 RepID=UPI0007F1395F|nr:hypothetical protein [Halomonas sp. HL-93]SBR45151.1 hypothetical protein GA0071314_0097 [Halomonas sp. HL-93]
MLKEKNEKIVERYYLQNLASKICYIEGKKEGLKYPQNFNKVSQCRVARYSKDSDISILRSKEYGTSHYGGLVVCAGAWVCPVCAPIIQAKRSERVSQAFHWAHSLDLRTDAIYISKEEHARRAFEDSQFENGFIFKKKRRQFMPTPELLTKNLKVALITFTTPHSRTDTVDTLFPKFQSAMAFMKEHRRYKDFKKSIGYVGEITATEMTFGENGPHIHRHVLYFMDDRYKDQTDNQEFADEVSEIVLKDFFDRAWGSALQKTGLLQNFGSKQYADFLAHGIDVIPRAHETDYLTKAGTEEWGADAEITKQSSKQGKKHGRTPFQILADSAKSAKDSETFLDYVKGTKGKAQLTFSAGFKNLIGLDELSDEKQDELDASESDDPADLLASLDYSDWSFVVKSKNRGQLLRIASEQGKEGIDAFIQSLKEGKQELTDEELFFKHYEKLLSLYKAYPNTYVNPELHKNSEDMKAFVVDHYSTDIEEIEKNNIGFEDKTEYTKKEKEVSDFSNVYILSKEEEERANSQSFKNMIKSITL